MHALATPTARIDEILFEGRGSDGALGDEAQTLAIPAEQFVRCVSPLRDVREPSHAPHRALWRAWQAFNTSPERVNSRDPNVLADYALTIETQYVAANGLGGFVRAAGSEDKDESATDPSVAAMSDAMRIRAAITLPALYQQSGDNPAIIDLSPLGEASASYEDRSLIVRQVFRVRLWGSRAYAP